MKQISFTMTISEEPFIYSFRDGLLEWISHIEKERESFSLEVGHTFREGGDLGSLLVKYKGNILFTISLYKKYDRNPDGHKVISGAFTIRCCVDGREVLSSDNDLRLSVNDKLQVNYNGRCNIGIVEALMDVLPLREDEKVKEICEVFGINEQNVVFDTYQKRYIINTPLPDFDIQEEDYPKSFYKYISLDVLISMLNNKTFRMNAITAQSDRTESLYLGDFLCDEFEDPMERFKNLHRERHYLISSFTTSYDDVDMWNAYGDKGQGVMLDFEAVGDSLWRKVQYVDHESSPLRNYRDGMKKLKEKGIRIHFSAIDNRRRFVKDSKYVREKEWRLLRDYPGDLNYTMYQEKGVKRFAYYRDFDFEENLIPELQIKLVGAVVGPRLCQGTNDFSDIAYAVKNVFNLDLVNCSRCSIEDIDCL